MFDFGSRQTTSSVTLSKLKKMNIENLEKELEDLKNKL